MKLNSLAVISFLFFAMNSYAKVQFENPYIFVPLKGTDATAGYARIKNDGNKDVIFAIQSAQGFKTVETHETIEKQGRMAMEKVDSFVIKAKSELVLEPGGKHIMLFDPEKTMKKGALVKVEYTLDGKAQSEKFKLVERNSADGHHH